MIFRKKTSELMIIRIILNTYFASFCVGDDTVKFCKEISNYTVIQKEFQVTNTAHTFRLFPGFCRRN